MRGLRVAFVLAVLLVPGRAVAGPVTYTFQGTLNLLSGVDSLLLNGATLTILATADTLQAPVQTPVGMGFQKAKYTPASLTASVTNRPGGGVAQTFSYSAQLVTSNHFAPSGHIDGFTLDGASTTSPFGLLWMPSFQINFTSQNLFAGTDSGALPSFASADVANIQAGTLTNFNKFTFSVISPRASAQVQSVPEPSTAIAIGIGLLVVAARRRWRSG
jgi:hypothetical protein